MKRSFSRILLATLAILALLACDRDRISGSGSTSSSAGAPAKLGGSMILATTTSTRDSGLLDVLVPLFRQQTGVDVKVIAVGTGAALEMAARGDADAVFVHAPEAERRFVDQGHLLGGKRIMHNDFVLLGPPDDAAKVRAANGLADAMKRIADGGLFVSRGDDSGTHKRELALWRKAEIDATSLEHRVETGQGMGATLHVADERAGYTLSDRGTFLAQRDRLGLQIVFEGAEEMLNIYHAHVVNPAKHEGVKRPQAEAFVDFLVSAGVQERIGHYRAEIYGRPLFIPDALDGGAAGPAQPQPRGP